MKTLLVGVFMLTCAHPAYCQVTGSVSAGPADPRTPTPAPTGSTLWANAYARLGVSESAVAIATAVDGGAFSAVTSGPGGVASGPLVVRRASPAGDTLWEKSFHTVNGGAKSLVGTPDGGVLVSGVIAAAPFHQEWVIRLDQAGGLLWQTVVDNSASTSGIPHGQHYHPLTWADPFTAFVRSASISVASEGGAFVVGNRVLLDPVLFNTFQGTSICRLDPAGELVWQKSYDIPGPDIFNPTSELVEGCSTTAEGGVIAVGTLTVPGDPVDRVPFVIRTDPAGNLLWSAEYDWDVVPGTGKYHHFGRAVAPAGSAGWYIVGNSRHVSGTVGSVGALISWVLRVDPVGEVVWQRVVSAGARAHISLSSVSATPDAGLLLLGSYSDDGVRLWAARLDQGGQELWQKSYGNMDAALNSYGFASSNASEGGFYMVGQTLRITPGDTESLVIRTDPTGSILFNAPGGFTTETTNLVVTASQFSRTTPTVGVDTLAPVNVLHPSYPLADIVSGVTSLAP